MSQSVIRRFEQRVLKDKSGSDNSQVPAAAQITIHRQGATLSESMSIPVVTPDPVPIEVYDVGELKAPDIVEVDADEDKQTHQDHC